MATDFDLDFGGLSLQGPAKRIDTGPVFQVFPTLPTELRLKIITHALPKPSVLKLTANILIADPTFGLYLVFIVTPPNQNPSPSTGNSFTFGNQTIQAPRRWYVEERKLNLLLINHEFRDTYLKTFPLCLPTGFSRPWQMAGKIRYSIHDAVMFRNFGQLTTNPMVAQAFQRNWKIQDFWAQVQELHVTIEFANNEFVDACVTALEQMRGLRMVKVLLWKGFGDNQVESVKVQLLRAMRERVKVVERMLKEVVVQIGEEDQGVPVFELVEGDSNN